MRKLTLSAEREIIELAKHLAAREGASVSAMFSRFIRSLSGDGVSPDDVPADSVAARATGIIARARRNASRDLLANALMEKYGIRP